ncbi:threonine ammonia-lyase [Amycolatopsis nigrescens]|uniref:threonine ammonia-lyase n=1 Tax=Amycolatopsis nigrescens TaxID=381445 RepID=UPI00035E2F7C|nr:pyridoxal-phosphate dependent enzyme [Amycolatopsis nigrescens]
MTTTQTPLSLDKIAGASAVIDRRLRDTPQYVDEQLTAAIGKEVLVKFETVNPLRSFKGRGASFILHELGLAAPDTVVCASSGNFGQAVAFTARERGMPAEVFVPAGANPVKVARIRSFGAEVTEVPGDGFAAKEAAKEHVERQPGRVFLEDGNQSAIAEGAGTIGVELLRDGPLDAVVLPIGDGALITGVATWLREHCPGAKVIGVCAEGAPAQERSFRAGRVVPGEPVRTIADGMSIRVPVPAAVQRIGALVDDIVLVSDQDLLDAMRLLADTLGQLVEPAGAAGIAAIRTHSLPGARLATVLTGANPRP